MRGYSFTVDFEDYHDDIMEYAAQYKGDITNVVSPASLIKLLDNFADCGAPTGSPPHDAYRVMIALKEGIQQ